MNTATTRNQSDSPRMPLATTGGRMPETTHATPLGPGIPDMIPGTDLQPRPCSAHLVVVLSPDADFAGEIQERLRRAGHTARHTSATSGIFAMTDPRSLSLVLVDHRIRDWNMLRTEPSLRHVLLMVVIPFGCSYTEDHGIGDLELGIDGIHDLRDGFRLLTAKVGAYLRRARSYRIRRGTYQVGAIELDDDALEVTISGRPVTLSAKPFAILAALMREPSKVLSRSELIDRIWGQDFSVGEHTLDVHIHTIRKELNREPNRLCELITVKRVGFKLKPASPTGAIRARRTRPTFTSIPGSDTRSTRTPRPTPRFGRVIHLGPQPDPPLTSPTTTGMTSACG